MYWRPTTLMSSALPFGGSFASALAYSSPLGRLRELGSVRAGVGRVLDRGELHEREDGEADQDHRRGHRPADLQARVAADLRGDGALARAEADERVDQRALDADEDDDREDERDLVEAVDFVRVRRAARARREERERLGEQVAQGAGILFSPPEAA